MAANRSAVSLEDVAESGRLGRYRILKIAAGVAVLLFLVGWGALSWWFSSAGFQKFLDNNFRPRLKNRGIVFDDVDITPLGKIKITNLRIRLPNGEEILIPQVTGHTEYGSVVRGEAKVTLDVSDLARQYFAKSGQGVQLSEGSKILYVSLATSLMNPGKTIRGEVKLEGVKIVVTPPDKPDAAFPLHFREGSLSLIDHVLSSDGLTFSLPGLNDQLAAQGQEADLEMRFDGNIRSLFTAPEFVGGRVQTKIRTEPMWARSLVLLNLEEVTRKIRWFGPLGVKAKLEGPVFKPDVKGEIDTQGIRLRMRGDFRQIDIRFDWLKGPVDFQKDGSWGIDLVGGPLTGNYFRHRDQGMKPLVLKGEGFKAKGTYRDRVLNLEQVGFAAYKGRSLGRLTWDLNEKSIPLGGTRTGDTAYDYRLGFQDFDLGSFMQDLTGLARPMEGKFTGLLEGRGRTLMLERMHGEGRLVVKDLALGILPRQDELKKAIGPQATGELRGLRLGKLATEWAFRNGELRMPEFEVEGPEGGLKGNLRYNLLRLDVAGEAQVRIKPSGLQGRPNVRRVLGPRPALAATFGGKIVAPAVRYVASTANP